jgi:hypothetical protein
VNFQPPDLPEPDHDALWDAWFDKQKKNGMAVLTRSEWHERLDEAARDAYAEGRNDEREDSARAPLTPQQINSILAKFATQSEAVETADEATALMVLVIRDVEAMHDITVNREATA